MTSGVEARVRMRRMHAPRRSRSQKAEMLWGCWAREMAVWIVERGTGGPERMVAIVSLAERTSVEMDMVARCLGKGCGVVVRDIREFQAGRIMC